ncbi:MAG: hypothetical protein ABII06_15325 [Pseudomonadota bacterium]
MNLDHNQMSNRISNVEQEISNHEVRSLTPSLRHWTFDIGHSAVYPPLAAPKAARVRFSNSPQVADKSRSKTLIREEKGIAFITILLLLALTSALSLAFLQKASIGTSAVVSRGETMQAHYLAESAANHALWRLLNDPAFSPSETVYTMHSLGNGRYGYKVRKPTLTKFGTVATVGGVSNAVTNQSYVQYLKPYNIITAYDKSSQAIPKQRRLLGATWADPSDTVNDGPDSAKWLVLQGSPKKKEIIMGTLDAENDINLAVWDGTSWAHLNEFTTSSNAAYRCLDIAYENLAGKALVVGRYAASGDVRYNIWDGNDWVFATAQIDANLTPGSSLQHVDMASRPNSDEILIALAQFDNDLKVVQWNGSSFIDHGEIDTAMENNEVGGVEIVYEQQSGDALVLWGHSDAHQVYYSVWSGASLSPVGQVPFDFGKVPKVIRAAADPNSDFIFIAALDDSEDLNVAVWNGEAWIDSRELETSCYNDSEQVFDIAWEHSGEEVVITWAPSSGNKVRYFKWPKGTALSGHAVQNGPDFQATPHLVRLSPIAGTEKIVLLVKNASNELRYSLWTGNRFLGDPAILLESGLESAGFTFDVAESGVTYTGGSG